MMNNDNPVIDEISNISLDSDIPAFMLPGEMFPDFGKANVGYDGSGLPGL